MLSLTGTDQHVMPIEPQPNYLAKPGGCDRFFHERTVESCPVGREPVDDNARASRSRTSVDGDRADGMDPAAEV